MLDEFYKDPEIREYLKIFPKDQWKKCIYLSLLYGIRQIKEEHSIQKLISLENLTNQRGKQQKNNHKRYQKYDIKINILL